MVSNRGTGNEADDTEDYRQEIQGISPGTLVRPDLETNRPERYNGGIYGSFRTVLEKLVGYHQSDTDVSPRYTRTYRC